MRSEKKGPLRDGWLTSEGLVSIIKACKDAGVRRFRLEALEISFGEAEWSDTGGSEAAGEPVSQSPQNVRNSHAPVLTDTQEAQKREAEIAALREASRLEELRLSDPEAFEEEVFHDDNVEVIASERGG